MKSEAYYQGMRARMSELYKLGLEESCPYIPFSDEDSDWLMGWHSVNKNTQQMNLLIDELNESGINIKIQIEK